MWKLLKCKLLLKCELFLSFVNVLQAKAISNTPVTKQTGFVTGCSTEQKSDFPFTFSLYVFFLLWQFHQLQRIIPSRSHFSRADDASDSVWEIWTHNSAGSSLFLCYRLTTAGEKGGTREGKEGVEGRDYGGKLPLR